jgi:hypothetical protein
MRKQTKNGHNNSISSHPPAALTTQEKKENKNNQKISSLEEEENAPPKSAATALAQYARFPSASLSLSLSPLTLVSLRMNNTPSRMITSKRKNKRV